MMWKKVISMLLIAAMLAMPIGCGKDGNKDKDTTSGVETTDIGDDSAETDSRIMNRHRLRKKNMKVCLLRI